MVDEDCWYNSKVTIASGDLYVASLSSTQQMRKSIQVQFKPILRLGSSCAMHHAGMLGSEETIRPTLNVRYSVVDEGCWYISKLSSARGSLYGAKPEETTCTARTKN